MRALKRFKKECIRVDITRYSENSVTAYLGDEISEDTNKKLVHLKNELEKMNIVGVLEIVISYTSLIIYYDIFKTTGTNVEDTLKGIDLARLEKRTFKYNLVEIPVC